MRRVLSGVAETLLCSALCADLYPPPPPPYEDDDDDPADMQISECSGPLPGSEPCRFPKLEECAHFHYERVQLPVGTLSVSLRTAMDESLHSQHTTSASGGDEGDAQDWHMVQVTSGDECWLLQRSLENFRMLDEQLHRCIYDRKISGLPDLSTIGNRRTSRINGRSSETDDEVFVSNGEAGMHFNGAGDDADEELQEVLAAYLDRFSAIADNSLNCGPVLNWLQLDNKGHRLLVPSEESRSINTPAVAAAYSVRRYVSQARDELSLEVGDMISVIDMASPGESMWWRGKRGFQVGFFPQHCVHIIGDKVPRNMPLPPPVVGSLAISPIKPVLRKHGKLIAFFRSFILNRPSRRRLKQSGILKERVFGCDLGEHLLNSGHDIPTVLRCCAEFIESHGIVDGIYRLSGVTSNIQKLRNAFDEDRIPNLYTEDILQDIHSVASLLKMYFRELPNPLCTYQLYHSFVNAVQGATSGSSSVATRNPQADRERLLKMREAVQKLPPPHYRTLEYLMRHLAKVAKHGASTGMTSRNVAIVWAPNLLRCAELEVGGVAALQGVGVQAVVTEFLVCYTDLIFSDNLDLDLPPSNSNHSNNMSTLPPCSPKSSGGRQCRPKSLAINSTTPTKLITLEEARSKHCSGANTAANAALMASGGKLCLEDGGGYIEVGGGPASLPKMYHTVIELPGNIAGRKRNLGKRSPLGWRSFFSSSKSRGSTGSQGKSSSVGTVTGAGIRKASTPSVIVSETVTTDLDQDLRRKLRPVKSAESLTSGHSEPASCEDILGPLHSLQKPPGHNRSVSHDSYFDTLQTSANNSEGSLLDLSEIQLNFDLEESEMRIFSEDESLVSSPRIQAGGAHHHHHHGSGRRVLSRARPEEFNSNSANNSSNPSPKKQARVVLSPDSLSRKRTRLEDQLSDILYIDCNTPDNCVISTTAVVHSLPSQCCQVPEATSLPESNYQPKNKSPRSSDIDIKRQSLNLESSNTVMKSTIPKSLTEGEKLVMASEFTTPTPQSPVYKRLGDSSSTTTPLFTPDMEIKYQNLNESSQILYENTFPSSLYENNVLTTISITYKSPKKQHQQQNILVNVSSDQDIYEDVVNPEQALIPTAIASLPVQQASQPDVDRPRSMSALSDQKPTEVEMCEANGLFKRRPNSVSPTLFKNGCGRAGSASPRMELKINNSVEPADAQHSAVDIPRAESINLIDFSPMSDKRRSCDEIDFSPVNDKRKSCEEETINDSDVYQQVKYFRRSVHEINALLEPSEMNEPASITVVNIDTETHAGSDLDEHFDSLEPPDLLQHVYENVEYEKDDSEEEEQLPVDQVCGPNGQTAGNFRAEVEEKLPAAVEPVTGGGNNVMNLMKKFETKESNGGSVGEALPPCLRAKNAKNSIKTRSLDENAFIRELGSTSMRRQKSLEIVGLTSLTNSLPKSLNQPKELPLPDADVSLVEIHEKHEKNVAPVVDNAVTASVTAAATANEQQLNRERIEKYKEERRKFLHEKYRSESFKEDKDIILTRLKQKSSRSPGKEASTEAAEYAKDSLDYTPVENEGKARKQPSVKELSEEIDGKCSGKNDEDVFSRHRRKGSTEKISELEEKFSERTAAADTSDEFLKYRRKDGCLGASFRKSAEQQQQQSAAVEDKHKVNEAVLRPKKDVVKGDVPFWKQNSLGEEKSKLQIQEDITRRRKGFIDDKNSLGDFDFLRHRRKEANDVDFKVKDDDDKELKADDEFLRHRRRDPVVNERSQSVLEGRERGTLAESDATARRVSLESRRIEKRSPSYCIKDMKAIFESKSQQ